MKTYSFRNKFKIVFLIRIILCSAKNTKEIYCQGVCPDNQIEQKSGIIPLHMGMNRNNLDSLNLYNNYTLAHGDESSY